MTQSDDNQNSTPRSGDAPDTEVSVPTVGRYIVGDRIGAGGMGEVYQAWDPLLDRRVALKRITTESVPNEEHRRLLLQEARAASSLQHRAIVAVHDVLEVEEGDYIVEEYAVGTSLRDHLAEPFSLERFFDFAEECVEAVNVASTEGVVHCDLKPENILVSPEGRPRILDFGIARRVGSASAPEANDARSPTVPLDELKPRGTPAYLAPEVVGGAAIDSRVDIFSLGVVFYEMLTTRNPFHKGTTGATVTSVISETPDPPSSLNSEVPEELDKIILSMMAKDRDRRPHDPAQLLGELRNIRRTVLDRYRPRSWWERLIMSTPVRAAAVVVFGVLVYLAARGLVPDRGVQEGPTPYVIVEQFENLTTEPAVGYFASGLLEAIEARLSSLQGVYVVDADSEIGGAVSLEGSLQRAGDRLRISYRVVDREERVRLAGNVIEGRVDQLFELQDMVTNEIATVLEDRFDLDRHQRGDTSRPTPDVLAYELYLQARGILRNYEDPANLDAAIGLFENALDRDPDFSLAYAGLADAYWERWKETTDPKWTELAEEASYTALEKGPDYAESHVTLGNIYRETGKYGQAESEFRRAISIDDRNDEAYLGLALTQEAMGDCDAAVQTFLQAIEAQPDYWSNVSQMGAFYFRQGQLQEALACFQKVTELTPENVKVYSNLGAVHLRLGDADKAIEALEQSLALKPNYRAYSNLAYLYRAEGRLEEAAATFEKALALNPHDHRVWRSLGATYLDIPGQREAAHRATRRAIELAEPSLEVNPNDAQLLAVLAQYYETIGEHQRARRLVDRALVLAPDQSHVLSNAASVLAALGDPRAMEVVRMALEAGLPLESLGHEPVFDSIRATPEFKQMVEELRIAEETTD